MNAALNRNTYMNNVQLVHEEFSHVQQLPGVVHRILTAAFHGQEDLLRKHVTVDDEALHGQPRELHHRANSLQPRFQSRLRGSPSFLRIATKLCAEVADDCSSK